MAEMPSNLPKDPDDLEEEEEEEKEDLFKKEERRKEKRMMGPSAKQVEDKDRLLRKYYIYADMYHNNMGRHASFAAIQ